MNILTYLETNITDEWQILHQNDIWRTVLAIPPHKGDIQSLKGAISMSACTIYVILPTTGCDISDIDLIYTVPVNCQPGLGLTVLLQRKLFLEEYTYGVIHKIP